MFDTIEQILNTHTRAHTYAHIQTTQIYILHTPVVIKLMLFLVCRGVQVSSVQALAQDHRNDVISNTAAIVFGYTGILIKIIDYDTLNNTVH